MANITNLSLDGVSFSFFGGEEMFVDYSVRFSPGEFVVIRGAGGGGKSTLLKIVAGLLLPQAGSVVINDLKVSDMSFEEFLPWRLKIGYSPDMGGLLSNRTIAENLLLPLEYHRLISPEQAQERVRELMADFQLDGVATLRPSSVSGSQRKAACVARSLIMNPEVLLLDDPTTGLTGEARQALVRRIRQARTDGQLSFVMAASADQQFLEQFKYRILDLPRRRARVA